jgi:fructose-specific phosphotransferase system IIA component
MNLLDILRADTVKVPLVSTDKKGAIEELVDLLAEQGLVDDPQEMKDAVWQREQQRSTGIGEGLAIPHGKPPGLTEQHMAIGRPAEPLDFDSIDKQPARLIVLLASPPNRNSDHIQALGKVSRLMANRDFRESAFEAQSAGELFDLIQEAEEG